MSVDNDERHVSSNINSCIGFVKFNKIQPIISNKLDNKIILKPMPSNDNSILDILPLNVLMIVQKLLII